MSTVEKIKDWTAVLFVWGCVVVVVGFVIFAFVGLVYDESIIAAKCLQYGYPGHKLTWLFEGYCIKREEYSDIVVPMDKLK